MKKETLHTILLIAALLLILIFGDADPDIRQHPEIKPHTCIDKTHENCDGKCECDGLQCGNTLTTH
jgi:hypothetical protein